MMEKYDGKRIPDDATPGMLEMERCNTKTSYFKLTVSLSYSGDYIEVYIWHA